MQRPTASLCVIPSKSAPDDTKEPSPQDQRHSTFRLNHAAEDANNERRRTRGENEVGERGEKGSESSILLAPGEVIPNARSE